MKKKNYIGYYASGIILAGLISWDIASVKQNKADYPLYEILSEIDHTVRDSTVVAVVGSDYEGLTLPVPLTTILTEDQIDSMVWKALDIQGTADRILVPGIKVLIKPNIVGAVADHTGENTDTRVVKAIVKYVHAKCEGNCTILIGEASPRPMPYETHFSGGSAQWTVLWDKTGYPAVLAELKDLGINVDTVNLNGGNTSDPLQNLSEVNVPNGGYTRPQHGKYYIHNDIISADVYITVPVLKVHNPGITCGLKNQIGITPGNRYGFNKMKGVDADGNVNKLIHNSDPPRDWTDEEIVDLSLLAGIDLVVVDATLCLEKQKSYSASLGNQVRLNAIVAGNDPVAVDNICARMTGFNPDDVDHITLAELAGMGTNDTTLISVVGSSLFHVAKRLKKSTGDLRLMFGQTNRKWIISQAFPAGTTGDPIAHEFIENEADYIPLPGNAGWSEPIYFFDDNIDLGNYFAYADDIVSYIFSYAYSPEEKDALLQVGSGEGLYLYLNHELVYSYSGIRTYSYISETRTIHLRQGYNTILIKTMQSTGNYDFAMNICEPEINPEYAGHRVKGLKFLPSIDIIPDQISQLHTNQSSVAIACYPNPASDHTSINIIVSTPGNYRINIYNLQGKLIKTVLNMHLEPGSYSFDWDLQNHFVTPGTYYATEEYTGISVKVLVVKK